MRLHKECEFELFWFVYRVSILEKHSLISLDEILNVAIQIKAVEPAFFGEASVKRIPSGPS